MNEIVLQTSQSQINFQKTLELLDQSKLEKNQNQSENRIQINVQTQPVMDVSLKKLQEKVSGLTKETQIDNIDKIQQKYGPFNSKGETIKQHNVKKNILTGQNLSLEPVVNVSPKTKQKNIYKDKINVSISLKFTEQSEPNNQVNLQDIQKKILQIAKSIRQKAKDQNKKSLSISYEPTAINKKQKYSTMNSFMASIKTKSTVAADGKKTFISKNNKKADLKNNLFQTDKNNKSNNPLKLNAHLNSIQDVEFPQEEQSFQAEQSTNQNKSINLTEIQNLVSSSKIVKQILNGILKKVVKQSQQNSKKLPKIKLNLDPTQHHYGVTQFRKSILKQKKEIKMREFQKQKQREQILNKRRQIYYNSRFHPVGVKLSSIRLSKLVAKGNDIKQEKNISNQSQDGAIKNQTNKESIINGIDNFRSLQNKQDQKIMNQNQSFNTSQALNPQIQQLRSQSQLYKDLNNLTKQFENDSTPIQKMKKASQKQQQKTIFLLKTKKSEQKVQELNEQLTENQNQNIYQENNYEEQYETHLQKNSSSSKYYEQPQQYNEFESSDDEDLTKQ